MTSVPPTQPPAAPETDVRLTEAEWERLYRTMRNWRIDDRAMPQEVRVVVERIVAERVRVVEGERDAEVAEAEREMDKTLAIMEAACDRSDAATLRAESAEAAHRALQAAVEDLAAQWDRDDERDMTAAWASDRLRALLAGGAR